MTPPHGVIMLAYMVFAAASFGGGEQYLGVVVEDFESGYVDLLSYSDEDQHPNSWSLDSVVTHNNSFRSLKLWGNTWKLERIAPVVLDTGDVWRVAACIQSVGEIQGFGLVDSANSLLFSFAGTEELNPDQWVTVYQGAFPLSTWNLYYLTVADEWLSRFGYLPTITGMVFVNDRDNNPSAVIYFDDIVDMTDEVPPVPHVEISYTMGDVYWNASRQKSVDVQFFSSVTGTDTAGCMYRWQFGDGAISTQRNPQHTFLVEDDHPYTVVLEVTTPAGRLGYASCQIIVDAGPTSFPITLNFVGDVMMARGYEAAGGIIPTHGVNAIFTPTLSYLGSVADISVANLECPLANTGTAHPTKPIVFRSSPANASGLVYAGIDVVTLANNHILDYGLAGLQQTQATLRQRGILFSGAGVDAYEARRPVFRSVKGTSFAFLACSDRTGQYNNYQPFLDAGENKPGFANLTEYNLTRDIGEARRGADLVVVQMHAGREYSTSPGIQPGSTPQPEDGYGDEEYDPAFRSPLASDRSIRRYAIDAGADVVICHHPHIIQGFEVHQGKLIAHSLGNFVFDLGYAETFPSMILDAQVNASGFSRFTLTPVYIDDYIPRRAQGELGLHILDYLAMRSRELGTTLVVDRTGVQADIILDTLTLWPRNISGIRTLPLQLSSGWWTSKPERLPRSGSISAITNISPGGVWYYRLGRDVVWNGNFEDEGSTLWLLDASDERYDSTTAHSGRRSLLQRRTVGASTISTNLENRLPVSPGPAGYSVCGWIKTENGRNATVKAKFYSTRYGVEIGSGDMGSNVSGTTGWSFSSGDFTSPTGANFLDMQLESTGPTTGTGYVWFDDVSFVEWTEWRLYNPAEEFSTPNDIYWLQVRTSTSTPAATVTYNERTYHDNFTPASINVSINPGWNMVSNPVERPESLNVVKQVFPNSLFDYAYGFHPTNGYQQTQQLSPGPGYWAKFPGPETATIEGTVRYGDSIIVHAGWNMIGSISVPVDTSVVTSVPPGLQASLVYGYSGGYFPTDRILPGYGYWMKSDGDGVLVLSGFPAANRPHVQSASVVIPDVGSLTFTDAKGETQTLYFAGREAAYMPLSFFEMPPPPPSGVMDVRFASGHLLAVEDSGDGHDLPISLVGSAYPLTVVVAGTVVPGAVLLEGDVEHTLHAGLSLLLTRPGSSITLRFSSLSELPAEFALWQNYPNPFNPVTSIRFALPVESNVRVEIFNLVGQRVQTLLREDRKAGYHTLQWDGTGDNGTNVASGVYFLRLTADGVNGAGFSAVRKIVLVR